jgi:hypothetical protein
MSDERADPCCICLIPASRFEHSATALQDHPRQLRLNSTDRIAHDQGSLADAKTHDITYRRGTGMV